MLFFFPKENLADGIKPFQCPLFPPEEFPSEDFPFVLHVSLPPHISNRPVPYCQTGPDSAELNKILIQGHISFWIFQSHPLNHSCRLSGNMDGNHFSIQAVWTQRLDQGQVIRCRCTTTWLLCPWKCSNWEGNTSQGLLSQVGPPLLLFTTGHRWSHF